jgi:hypothetical protein
MRDNHAAPVNLSRSVGAGPSTAVTRRVHLLRIDFAKMMDAWVKPAHHDRFNQIDRELP